MHSTIEGYMTQPIQFEIKGIGKVTMVGTGPWKVREYSGAARNIFDANDRPADPFVLSKFRTAANVTFARYEDARAVVEKANEILLQEGATF
jgi:hypothetical protein